MQDSTEGSAAGAGVDSGMTMRVGGQGYPAPKGMDGARPGDLLVDLIVEPSPVFQRDGADLSMHVPVDFTDAALGTYVKCAACSGALTTPSCRACSWPLHGCVARLVGSASAALRSSEIV